MIYVSILMESKENPQVNAIVELAQQMFGNYVGVSNFQDKPYYDLHDPWGGILAAVAFRLRSTYHMTLQATPDQLIFGRDMVLNVQHLTARLDCDQST
jgi:hypothetical protein